ncbi:hypothetical protein ACHAWF_005668 [Thalassiosira exigua]
MTSLGEDAAATAVTAHDWVLGIAFSILASVIGGASKLSIRKSFRAFRGWLIAAPCVRRPSGLIDARRKWLRGDGNNVYEEIMSPPNSPPPRGDISVTSLTPLEVGPPPHARVGREGESFSSHDDDRASPRVDCNGFFDESNAAGTAKMSPRLASWLLYLAGMIGMLFLNPTCNVLAMQHANPSILVPFSGLTLVWVVLFSRRAVGERPGRSQRVACALIVAGEAIVALFGDHTNGKGLGVEDVLASYSDPAFQAFLVLWTLIIFQMAIFIRVCPKTSLLKKLSWGCIGGSVTGFQNFVKDSLIIVDATSKQSQNSSSGDLPGAFYVFVALAMLTATLGLLFLAACMKRYDATYSAAMFVVSFIVSTSLMSSVHYNTFEHLAGVQDYILYPVGLSTLFAGAFILIKPNAANVLHINKEGSAEASFDYDASGFGQRHDESYTEMLLPGN